MKYLMLSAEMVAVSIRSMVVSWWDKPELTTAVDIF